VVWQGSHHRWRNLGVGNFLYIVAMKLSYTYWQNDGFYIGHLNEYPECDTQGKSLAELETMLKSLYEDISSGELEGIKRVGVLEYETA